MFHTLYVISALSFKIFVLDDLLKKDFDSNKYKSQQIPKKKS